MKRILIYIIITLILISVFYYLLHYGFFSNYNYISALNSIKKGKITIILPSDSDVTKELQDFNSKYGIKTMIVDINYFNFKGIEIYNNLIDDALVKRLGDKTYKKYRSELDSLSQTWIVFP